MSEAPINLDWIGGTLRAIQAELRSIRDEREALRQQVSDVRSDLGSFESVVARAVGDQLASAERRMADRTARFEAHIDTRLDKLMRHLGMEDLG
jgi:DNA-binding transcriptional regulator YbjK